MAVETDGSRFGAGAREALRRGVSASSFYGRAARDAAHDLSAHVAKAFADLRTLAHRLQLYELIVRGPLVRFVSATLQRRILANPIGLAILLGGIFYVSQHHAWLIDAKSRRCGCRARSSPTPSQRTLASRTAAS